ncbi:MULTISPECIES: hypothetical protein [unclassified Mesorhizobium]|uniref:hypothetical protein n=1 Tax=unclassified Mesorhizobium TaxID=325217 RepID=UPI000FD7DA84|nr:MULTISPECIES: hypothetical protein [unclassified Mesorhizobium]TGQ16500.1 hypothetical protein EN862_003145 [Mesorhizobium sp. M2E.F.Ca.ET.219.01.1.1]TGT77404.1 hypothetical protein EN809_007420 [Mesorhizobium sp. M2E.F.Ca.ET.166.01.1.1]TGW03512.1 hypothetical protein EN797_007420 [Mesorhizobium sp. M2E.F.Ca.ET.154.01.1.1]
MIMIMVSILEPFLSDSNDEGSWCEAKIVRRRRSFREIALKLTAGNEAQLSGELHLDECSIALIRPIAARMRYSSVPRSNAAYLWADRARKWR